MNFVDYDTHSHTKWLYYFRSSLGKFDWRAVFAHVSIELSEILIVFILFVDFLRSSHAGLFQFINITYREEIRFFSPTMFFYTHTQILSRGKWQENKLSHHIKTGIPIIINQFSTKYGT